MIFYLRNNRVIARFKRIDNARARAIENESGKSCRAIENELHARKGNYREEKEKQQQQEEEEDGERREEDRYSGREGNGKGGEGGKMRGEVKGEL